MINIFSGCFIAFSVKMEKPQFGASLLYAHADQHVDVLTSGLGQKLQHA